MSTTVTNIKKRRIPAALNKILHLSLTAILFNTANARVHLPSLISDNMILQRESTVKLWGSASPNKRITILTSWDRHKYVASSNAEGNWEIKVTTGMGGGPYEISLDDGDKVVLKNVLLGEVWVCSGQSNMEMPIKGWKLNQPVFNAADVLLDADNENIRLFKVDKFASDSLRKDSKGKWLVSSAQSVYDFSAVGYFFSKFLQAKLKVPVGMIQAAWGGTAIEGWMSKESLVKFNPEIEGKSKEELQKAKYSTLMYNGLINPLINYTIKGVLWYQGETNIPEADKYSKLFPAMVSDWRNRWGLGDFPFYYVQIVPHSYSRGEKLSLQTAYMRDIQRVVMKSIPNSGVAIGMDVGDSALEHPPGKELIARRLLYWALGKTYLWKGISFQSPEFKESLIRNDRILVKFNFATNGMTSYGKPITGFEIAGDDKIFYPARAVITDEGIEVSAEKVVKPVAVRYGYKDWMQGCLYNGDGLPLSSFRTDSWNLW